MTECYRLILTEEFEAWLDKESPRSRYQIDTRLAKIRLDGYFGTHKSVSSYEKGELKIKFGNSSLMMEDVFIMLTSQKKIYCYY